MYLPPLQIEYNICKRRRTDVGASRYLSAHTPVCGGLGAHILQIISQFKKERMLMGGI